MGASLQVATTALTTIKEARSHASFERDIAHLHFAGVKVGTKNHSREFLRRFIPSMRRIALPLCTTAIATTTVQLEARASARRSSRAPLSSGN